MLVLTEASGLDPAIHPTNKALTLVTALAEAGVGPAEALAGTGVNAADLCNPSARMSVRQLLTICRNAMARIDDPLFALRTGRRVHATHLGYFGFALMSAATSREALDCLRRYRPLSTPIVGVALEERDGRCTLSYFDSLDMGDDLFRFVLDFQMGIAWTLLKDTIGADFALDRVCVTYPAGADRGEREGLLEAPIEFDCDRNALVWDSAWLDCPQPNANPLTSTMVRETCDQLLASEYLRSGTAGQVARLLAEPGTRFPGLEALAVRLHVTSRTLRRRLSAEGTSYADILASVRRTRAIEYLRTTRMKTEEIADALGFSDVANFRHAFRKWTGRSPSDYRTRVRAGKESVDAA